MRVGGGKFGILRIRCPFLLFATRDFDTAHMKSKIKSSVCDKISLKAKATRSDDPRHTARTNTPGEGPVLCYQSCHNHPKRVFCRATRAEYFARIVAKGR